MCEGRAVLARQRGATRVLGEAARCNASVVRRVRGSSGVRCVGALLHAWARGYEAEWCVRGLESSSVVGVAGVAVGIPLSHHRLLLPASRFGTIYKKKKSFFSTLI